VHYFYKSSLMRDVMATCGDHSRTKNGTSACFVSNHGAGTTFSGTVTLTAYDHFGTGAGAVVVSKPVEMLAGPGALEWFNADLPPGNTSSIISTVHNAEGEVMSEHMVQLVKPMELRVPLAELSFKIAPTAKKDGTIDIAVSSTKVALWVTLTTLAQGRFSDNAFLLPATSRTIQFVPNSPSTAATDLQVLKASLRIEDFSMYRPLV
jgi:beta-mannosidase